MTTVRLTLKEDYDDSQLETGSVCLGYKVIDLLFNAGPLPSGHDMLIVKANDEIIFINSGDLLHDIDAYTMELI